MSQHGPQFDEFRRNVDAPHGGPEYDERFADGPGGQRAHGPEDDEKYRRMAAVSKHGERWDDFNWTQMPAKHGRNFDEDFGMPTVLAGGKHGTWMDVFTGGTQVRYMKGAKDLEGIVIRCSPTHVVVQQRYTENQGGKRADTSEVALGQIREWRMANREAKRPMPSRPIDQTPSDAPAREASPSASALGGGRTSGPTVSDSTTMGKTHDDDDDDIGKTTEEELDELIEKAFAELGPDVLDEVEEIAKGGKRGSLTPGTATTRRRGTATPKAPRLPSGKIDHAQARQILAQRSANFRAGVAASREKSLPKVHHGGFKCTNCSHTSWREHPVAAASGGVHKQISMRGCASCGTMHPHRVGKTEPVDVDIVKAVDTSETALIGPADQDAAKTVGHRSGCPRGGGGPCGAEQGGECSTCGATVRDHEALGKQLQPDPLAEVRKLARL